MSENDVAPLIARFVDRASLADNEEKVKACVDDGLASLAAVGTLQDNAIHMLTTAIASHAEQNEAGSSNLFQVFIELERRKAPAIDILPLLVSAGPLPLAELNMRSGGSPGQLFEELRSLGAQGLIEVEGGIPDRAEDLRTDRRTVRLTRRGTGRAFR